MNHPAGIDLAPLRDTFFDEAAENLDRFEQLLLVLAQAQADDETLHALFRCAHSVKGGAATFGLADVTEFTHRLEALLDRWRRHEQAPTEAAIDTLFAAGDALRALLGHHRGGGAGPAPDLSVLGTELQRLAGAPGAPPQPVRHARRVELTLAAGVEAGAAEAVTELFADIGDLGRIEALAPAADGARRYLIETDCSDAELTDLFAFHVEAAAIGLAPAPAASATAGATADTATETPPAAAAASAAVAATAATAPAEAGATLRVPVDKVDLLLNQVGELVLAQSMLVQACGAIDAAAQQRIEPALAVLQRQARALQDTVMAVRMVPVAAVFARFPRLVRELAAQLGKRVELTLEGEATELDKGMVERIVDPLTHLVRNALDHGIEPPAERRARGKPEAGRLTLSAAHEGTSVVVTVRDDGAGLSRAKLLAKARERGLHAPDGLRDDEVWALIFAPGFSTAAEVTEVSGRGVGMDVVQRNVAALGGSIGIDAVEGRGLVLQVRLPLTLAILDAMLVRVADECYALPLASVIESFRPEDATPGRLAGQRIVRLRDAVLPVLTLQQLFDVPPLAGADARRVLVAVEADGGRIALEVDELIGQQQVVVKNLLAHCPPVPHVGAATVLGDGRVALILDIASLVRHARRGRSEPPVRRNLEPVP
jgi:two-component system chemotaxis sensor kinase CheA